MHDQTNYNDPSTKAFLNVPVENQNKDLFSLRQNKSVNVNIYPVLANLYLLKNANQKISIYTGIGMQIFNFRFNKPIEFQNVTQPEVVMSNLHLSKNKLSVMYGTIPISLLMKSRLAGNTWLVYGFGVMGGVNMSTWTKQKSYENGKVKNHDMFNLDRFNTTLTAEFGIDDRFRIFGTYQLNSMYKDGLVQNPYSIGIRLLSL